MTDEPIANQPTTLAGEIEKMLRIQDAGSLAGSLGKLLMGLGVCLAAAFVFASVISFILWQSLDKTFIGWRGWFSVFMLLLVPLIIWYERRTRKDFLSEAAAGVDMSPSSMGEQRIDQFKLQVAGFASLIVWGPRAIVDGFHGLQGVHSTRDNAVFTRAVLLVTDLAKSETRVAIKRLLHPPENMQVFALAVDLLDKHNWIGKASDGKSLWLNSMFRDKLRGMR